MDDLYAWVCRKNGQTLICGCLDNGVMIMLIGTNLNKIYSRAPVARQCAKDAQADLQLVRLQCDDVIEDLRYRGGRLVDAESL